MAKESRAILCSLPSPLTPHLISPVSVARRPLPLALLLEATSPGQALSRLPVYQAIRWHPRHQVTSQMWAPTLP